MCTKRLVFMMKHWDKAVVSCSQVFVEYANAGDSKEAQRLLTGRTFDGKFVVATFYPLSAYKRGYLYQTVQWGATSTIMFQYKHGLVVKHSVVLYHKYLG